MKKCPRCHKKKLNDDRVLNPLSRRDGKTYICNDCGDEEVMIDCGCDLGAEITLRESEFAKTHTRKRKCPTLSK